MTLLLPVVVALLAPLVVATPANALNAPAAAGDTCAPFPDVNADNVHCANVAWLAGQGITKPIGGRYAPDNGVTRGAMTAFLFRLTHPGQASPGCTERPFADVPVDSTFCGYITWAADEGLAFGYGDGRFGPAETVSRGAMAAFLYRLRHPGVPAPSCTEQPFKDVRETSTFCGVITWLRSVGVTVGSQQGTVYKTREDVTRASMATFLRRMADLPENLWQCRVPDRGPAWDRDYPADSGSDSDRHYPRDGHTTLAATSSRYALGPVQPRAVLVAEAIGPRFGITSIHGWRAGRGADDISDHPAGLALDFMVGTTDAGEQLGWEVAEYIQRNQSWIGVKYVIFQQQIWQAGRPYDSWSEMEDRGSPTANHMDHVHLSLTPDNAATLSCRR